MVQAPRKPASGRATVQALFEKQANEFTKALAGQMPTERFIRVALTAYSNGDARFQSAEPISLLAACMQAAQLGVSVDPLLGEFWLIPRRNSKRNCMWINGQLGYKGLVKLARRNSNFRTVKPELVHEGDFFEYELGSNPFIRHRFAADRKQRPEVQFSYATVHYRDGSSMSHVSPMYEILEARERSEAFRNGYGPWVDHFNSMCKVVPLRAIMKLEAIDDIVLRQISMDERSELNGDVIEVDLGMDSLPPDAEPPPIQISAPGTVDDLKAKFGSGKTQPPEESS